MLFDTQDQFDPEITPEGWFDSDLQTSDGSTPISNSDTNGAITESAAVVISVATTDAGSDAEVSALVARYIIDLAATPGILDAFNRADENPLSNGGLWARPDPGGGFLKIVSNVVASNDTFADSAYWTPETFGPDSDAGITISALANDGGGIRVYVRLVNVNIDSNYGGYYIRWTYSAAGTDTIQLFKTNPATQIATYSQDLGVGDKIRIRAIGNVIQAWIYQSGTWTMLGSVTDSTYTAAGYVGFGISNTTARADDFFGGTAIPVPNIADTGTGSSENTTITVPISASDVNGVTTEITSTKLNASDANATTTEAVSLLATFAVSDSGSVSSEIISLRLAAADSNSVTTETSSVSAPISASDINGATTEGNSLAAQESSSDVNGALTESTALRLSASDVNGTVTDTPTVKAVISVTDQNGATTELGTTGTNTPVSSSDSNSATTETTALVVVLTVADASAAATDLGTLQAVSTTADVNSTVTEIISSFKMAVTDVNGATSENGVISAATFTVTDSGSGADSASLAAQLSGVQTGSGVDSGALKASYVLLEGSTTVELANVSKIALTVLEDGTIIEEQYVLKPGVITPNAPRILLGADIETPVLTGAQEEQAELEASGISKPVLGGATGRG